MDMPEISNQLKPRQIERFKTKLEKQANRMMEQHIAFSVSFLNVRFLLELKLEPTLILAKFIARLTPVIQNLLIRMTDSSSLTALWYLQTILSIDGTISSNFQNLFNFKEYCPESTSAEEEEEDESERYDRNDPCKAVGQITKALEKWGLENNRNCRAASRNVDNEWKFHNRVTDRLKKLRNDVREELQCPQMHFNSNMSYYMARIISNIILFIQHVYAPNSDALFMHF